MNWITREKVKVDRVACPWLIKKFVADAHYWRWFDAICRNAIRFHEKPAAPADCGNHRSHQSERL